jgi:PAS domain S-box-containing protein
LFLDAEYRRLGSGPLPAPVRLTTAQALSGRRDADLVTLSARVIGRETRRVATVEHEVLLLQDNGTVFEALCELRGTNTLPATPRNAVVEASGICTVQPLASGEMRTLRLWLREPADLHVLGQAAPWESLLPGRILAVSGGLGALALAWIVALRRQVAQRRQAEEKARRSEATTRTINYFATSLLERHHEDEILWDLAENCVSQLGFVDCVIYLLNRDQKILVQKAAFGPKNPDGRRILNPITIPLGKGIVGSVARSGKTELIGDTRLDKRYICDDEFRLSEITVPIVAGEEVLGVIDAEHPKENFFTQEHLEILTGIASLCANKLLRVRSEEKLRGLNVDLEKRVADRTAALQESEAKFRALYEGAGMAVIVHDEHTVLDCNPATLRIFGYSSRDQFVGKHPAELSAPVQPNGEDSMAAAQRHIAEALAKGSHQFEWLSKRGDGTPVPVEIVLTPMQFNGRNVIQAVVQDITERKRAEASLRTVEARKAAVLETALDSIITIDQQGHILDFNPAAERTFGYSRAEALGREMAELIIPPALRDRHRAGLKRAVKTGMDTMMGRRIEISALRRSGEEFTVELALARIQTEEGPIFTAHIQDISERKRAEAEMERALAHEKELSELKSRFVAMVSHEFRTPLGIIMSSAEILDAYLDRLPPEERRANLKDIFQSSKHMASMMEEVLLLGRVEAGKMTCRPVPMDLVSFCEKLVDEIGSATTNRCSIQLSAPRDLPEAQADESLLRHIFNNLLNNAVKYSPNGSAVQFTLEAHGPLAVFTVRDRGIGIPEADQRQLFQAFHRGRNVGETPGTGLGMVIVKHCVQLHQGKIAFQSREAQGTTFAVGLPLFGSINNANGETTRFIRESVQGQTLTIIP